jgi:CxxC motif-containing protein
VDTYTEPTGHHHVAVEKEDVIEYTCPDCGDTYTEEIVRDPVSLTNTLFTTAWGMDFVTSIEAKAPIAKGGKFHLYYNAEVATFVSVTGSAKITIDTSVAGELSVKVLEDIAAGEKLMDLNFKTFEYLNTGSYTLLSVDENSKPLCEFTDLAIYQMGDVNMDGNINSRDVLMIKQSVVRMIELTDVQKIYANVYVDTDKDGQPLINSRDAMLIQQYVVRMPVELGDRISLTFTYGEGESIMYSIHKGEALTDLPDTPEGYVWSLDQEEFIVPNFASISEETTYYLVKK